MNVIKHQIEKSLSTEEKKLLNITRMRPLANGGIIIDVETKEDQLYAIKTMREKGPLLDFTAEEPRKMNPRIIIPNVPDYIGEEELIYELKTHS